LNIGSILSSVPERSPAGADTVAAIVASLQARGAPAASIDAARSLGEPDRLAVVAGQQPGLLGGPLYTVLKAAGVLRAAEALNRREAERGAKRRWIAVFWNASEDHDFDEINRVFLEDSADGPPRRFGANLDGGGRALRDVPADDPAFGTLLDEVEAALPGSEFRDGTMALFRETRAAADSVADWFARLILRWFGDRGLVVVEPDHVRAASVPLMRSEFEHPGRLSAAVREGIELRRRAGHEAVLDGERDVNLFRIHEGRRVAIERAGDGFRLSGTDEVSPADEWIRRVESDPASFSTNVHLRPLVQDATLPVGIQLGGPAEVAYLHELEPAFASVGLAPAVVLDRPSAIVVERRVERWLAKFDVTAEAYLADPTILDPPEGDDADPAVATVERFARIRAALDPELTEAIARAAEMDPGVEKKARRLADRATTELERMGKALEDAERERAGIGRRQRERIAHALRPTGRPQERIYGIAPLLARYGPGVVDALIDGAEPFRDVASIVRLPRVETPPDGMMNS